jgi:hypothetical protein
VRIIVPTVQHSGTLFLVRSILGKNGFEVLPFRGEPTKEHTVNYGHCWPGELKYMRPLIRKYPIIVPLRHPYLVAETWRRRNRTPLEMMLQWEILMQEVDPQGPFYLPIDRDDRGEWLDSINNQLGLQLSTDWQPLNSHTGTFNITPDKAILPDETIEFFNQPFFRRFYPLGDVQRQPPPGLRARAGRRSINRAHRG